MRIKVYKKYHINATKDREFPIHKCKHCGKLFHRRYTGAHCSVECRKATIKAYNTAYVREMRRRKKCIDN